MGGITPNPWDRSPGQNAMPSMVGSWEVTWLKKMQNYFTPLYHIYFKVIISVK
jgi:hypothetical protein